MSWSFFTIQRAVRDGLALALGIAAAAVTPEVAAEARMPTHVACVGDSITAGYAASSASAAYPSVLQTKFGSQVQVRNFGHSGATMLSVGDLPYQNQSEYTSATTFVAGAGANAVVDVIMMLGTNDSKSYNWKVGTGTRAQQFVTDCSAMVDHFASLATHPLVYLALPPRAFANSYGIDGTIIYDQIRPLIQQVAAQKGLPVIDVDAPTQSHPELFPDGVHPNDTGYALIAQVMYTGLLSTPNGDGGVSPEAGPADAGKADGATAEGGTRREGGSIDAGGTGGAADASSRTSDGGGTGTSTGGATATTAGAGTTAGSTGATGASAGATGASAGSTGATSATGASTGSTGATSATGASTGSTGAIGTNTGSTGAAGSTAASTGTGGTTAGPAGGTGGAPSTDGTAGAGSDDSGCSCGVAAGRGSRFGNIALVLAFMASTRLRTRSKRRR